MRKCVPKGVVPKGCTKGYTKGCIDTDCVPEGVPIGVMFYYVVAEGVLFLVRIPNNWAGCLANKDAIPLIRICNV